MLFISYGSGRTSSIMLNVSDEGRHPFLFLILEGRTQSFTIKNYGKYMSLVDDLYQIEEVSLVLTFMAVFIENKHWNLSSDSASLIDMITPFFLPY